MGDTLVEIRFVKLFPNIFFYQRVVVHLKYSCSQHFIAFTSTQSNSGAEDTYSLSSQVSELDYYRDKSKEVVVLYFT